jgi:hypothetical protein
MKRDHFDGVTSSPTERPHKEAETDKPKEGEETRGWSIEKREELPKSPNTLR